MLILGVESSCDETAAAVLANHTTLLSNVINSQIELHSQYGGVVPELASRNHVENIYPVVQEALSQAGITLTDLDGLAVTQGPGLIGSLLVGLSFVKAISYAKQIPYVGIDHISGHLLSVFLSDSHPDFPYIALVASGGHSSIFKVDSWSSYSLLGRSRDDAAGEAFDKVAKLLGLSYPGGPVISELSLSGDPHKINFPRAWLDKDSFDFSFSGVKTSVANHVNQCSQKNIPPAVADICASFQEAVCDVLVAKTIRAAQLHGISSIVVAGGVASNPRLRNMFSERCADHGLNLFLTPKKFCTDNAAMIALSGSYQFDTNKTLTYDMDVYSRSPILA